MKTDHVIARLAHTTLLLVVLFVPPVRAQMSGAAEDASHTWAALIAQEGAWTNVLTAGAVPVGLANLDLNALTPREWKQLRAELITTLRSGRDAAWEDAAQQVIYLAFYYRDKIKLAHTSAPLLDSYILDRSEQHRIMALAALHAIGDHDAMAHLAQRVRLEGSPRVRRLTVAALADHYGVRSYYDRATVTVGKPSVVTEGQPQKREGQ